MRQVRSFVTENVLLLSLIFFFARDTVLIEFVQPAKLFVEWELTCSVEKLSAREDHDVVGQGAEHDFAGLGPVGART